ncbi:MAG: EpsI family protein [Desulfobulbus sp.]|nr:EpsI family protein [Desulfobulbus sp.]
MGSLSWVRVSVVVIVLVAAGLAVQAFRQTVSHHPTAALSSVFTAFGNWKTAGDIPLDDGVRESLHLDDYLFRRFSNGRTTVELYIGYYHSVAKVGAAHDPLVCFPGQGWVLRNKQAVARTMRNPHGDMTLKYTTMLAERDDEQDLLLYWFQAGRRMAANTFMQKVYAAQSRFTGQGEANAFVRISIPLRGLSVAEGKEVLSRFVADFYPVFLSFAVQSSGGAER